MDRATPTKPCALQLPKGNKFPGARSERLGGCVRTTILDAAAAAAMLLDDIDAAHCAVHSEPSAAGGLAPEATRFCSVVVKPESELSGALPPPRSPPELENVLVSRTSLAIAAGQWDDR